MKDDQKEQIGEECKITTNMKMPPFWSERPELWFAQIEAQFGLHRIASDQVKFNMVVAQLEGTTLQYIADTVVNPPLIDKYITIKTKLIECFAESQQSKLQKLLSEVQLGDQKPSQLLARQRMLADQKVSDEFLKTLWLRQLPITIQSVLAVGSGTLEEMAKLADKISEISPGHQLNAVKQQTPQNQTVEERLDKITKWLERLDMANRQRARSISSDRTNSKFKHKRNNSSKPSSVPSSLLGKSDKMQPTMQISKKLKNSEAGPRDQTRNMARICVSDTKNALKFLIDTGADVSTIPPAVRDLANKPSITQLFAANGS